MTEIKPRVCPVCLNEASLRITKDYAVVAASNLNNSESQKTNLSKYVSVNYFQCESCKMLFSDPLSQEGLVGGQHEEGRALQNDIRLGRIKTMTEGMSKENVR